MQGLATGCPRHPLTCETEMKRLSPEGAHEPGRQRQRLWTSAIFHNKTARRQSQGPELLPALGRPTLQLIINGLTGVTETEEDQEPVVLYKQAECDEVVDVSKEGEDGSGSIAEHL